MKRIALLLVVTAFTGCNNTKPDETAATVAAPALPPAPAAPAAPPLATVAAPAAVDTDIPTPEDFEQQALDDINPQNLEQELDRLEKEIGQ